MKNAIIFFLLFTTTTLFSQNKEHFIVPDSLKKMSFETLEKRFDNSLLNKVKLNIYAKTYYKKSKLQNDEIIIANGMYMAAYIALSDVIALQYADSIIALTKNGKDLQYPAKGYIFKSNIFFTKDQLHNALFNILEAEKYCNKAANPEQKILVKQQIGLIKIELGKPKEALPLILENYDYFKSESTKSPEFIYSAWILSDIYNRLEKPNISLFYIDIILRDIKKENRYYKYFLLNKGVSYNLKKQYAKSNALLDQAISLLKNDKLNLSISYYYRGENILQGEKNIIKSKLYFEKVDSILNTTNEFSALLRNNYINLIEITKRLKEDKQQLFYLNRLIEIDKRLNKNNILLSDNINHNYDTPILLSEKEGIIVKINQEKFLYILLGFIVLVGLGISLYYLSKSQKEKNLYEERFNALMEQPKSEIILNNIITEENKIKSFDLPITIAKDLLRKLTLFEEDQGYLELNLKLNDLTKQFDTNSSYLSKTINHYKGKNFSKYLNDLRIVFVVEKLKSDKKFRKYTIKAIAEEVGFSNSESFSKAFYNHTGLQPSYFIKKLDENNEN